MSRTRNCDLKRTGFLEAIWALVQLCLVVVLPHIPTLAQITPDTTLEAEASRITPGANVQGLPADLIEGGAIRDTNLFHSFQEFNVNSGQRVYFANPTNIKNIFSRVTGNNVSNILGTLGVNGNANLFLLNPNGIVFGSNAKLDINGSFLVTTANSFQFPGGTQFSATSPQAPSLLSINVPLGVQYGAQPGKITVNQANLELSSQQNVPTSVILLGGDVELNASKLTVPGRLSELGGLAGEGSVGLNVNGSLVTLGEFIGTQGNVSTSGTTISATATGASDNVSGDIWLTGRNVQITSSKIESVGNDKSYGTIRIKASGSVFLNNTTLDTRNSQENGYGGDIFINAPNQISISNSAISSKGYFGRIFLGSIDPVQEKDPIQPKTVVIENSTLTSETATTARHSTNDIGLVSIRANDSVEIKNGSQLNATTSGKDDAGNITISAPDGTVVIDNRSQLVSESKSNAEGNAGYIEIQAKSLLVDNAQVSVDDKSLNKPINSNNDNTDDLDSLDNFDDIEKFPGRIYIIADQIRLDNQASIKADSASADGGNIFIGVSEQLLLRRGSLISAEAGTDQQGGGGNGGNIQIFAEDGFIAAVPSENSDIIANAFDGNGGDISIVAKKVLGLKQQTGQNTSQLRSNRSSDISASSEFGFAGEIEINTLDIDPAQGLVELSVTPVDPTGLIAQGCESRNSGVAKGQSTFVVTGRGGLPPNPDNPLTTGATPPPWVTRDSGRVSKAAAVVTLPSRTPTSPLVEAQGMVIGSHGEVILTAGVAGATPHSSGLSVPGCSGER